MKTVHECYRARNMRAALKRAHSVELKIHNRISKMTRRVTQMYLNVATAPPGGYFLPLL